MVNYTFSFNKTTTSRKNITIFVVIFHCICCPFFIAGRPKAALLFWFFCDFRCGVPLLIVIRVIYKYRNR